MINDSLIHPENIVVVGGSNDNAKPGGKIVRNLLSGNFTGRITVINPNHSEVQGLKSYSSVATHPEVELAIILIRADYCLDVVRALVNEKNTKALIIISAGFGELREEGRKIEEEIARIVDESGACLIGPNCIGVLNTNYRGVFTTPIPELDPQGCDLVSSSGATAVFIMESGVIDGLRFSSVISIGNGIQTSVEDVLEYWDKTFDVNKSSKIKLLYIESITEPDRFLKHATSLVSKGCKMAAIKAGSTEVGMRAAASHTGALSSSDLLVRALFRKAGIVYCSSREELITVASVFCYKQLEGPNIGIITHAGGSAVLLSDALSKGGLKVPQLEGPEADELLGYLNPGSSVKNPIDFLATGTADQLGIIIDYCEHKFDELDALIVVFGSPGLFDVENVYKVLSVKLETCQKPIYPVLPSVVNAKKEIDYFLSRGYVNFPNEVELGRALCEVYNTPYLIDDTPEQVQIDKKKIREIVDNASDGFLSASEVAAIIKAINIDGPQEGIVHSEKEAVRLAMKLQFPVAMKVVGPIHKTDVDGVHLNVSDEGSVERTFNRLMEIEGAEGVMIQQMLSGVELYIGGTYDPSFGHAVFFGSGGVLIELFKDVQTALVPVYRKEVAHMLRKLRSFPLFQGVRGKKAVSEKVFTELIIKVSELMRTAPEITELDINPLIADGETIVAVDMRIKIESR